MGFPGDSSGLAPGAIARAGASFYAAYGQAVANYSRGSTVRGCYPADFSTGAGVTAGAGGTALALDTGNGTVGANAIAAQRSAAFYAPPTVVGQVCQGMTPPPCCAPIT